MHKAPACSALLSAAPVPMLSAGQQPRHLPTISFTCAAHEPTQHATPCHRDGALTAHVQGLQWIGEAACSGKGQHSIQNSRRSSGVRSHMLQSLLCSWRTADGAVSNGRSTIPHLTYTLP